MGTSAVLWCFVASDGVLLVGSWVFLGGVRGDVWGLSPFGGCMCGEWFVWGGGGCAIFSLVWWVRFALRGPGLRWRACLCEGACRWLGVSCGLLVVSTFGWLLAPDGGWRCFSSLCNASGGVAGYAGLGHVLVAVIWGLLMRCGVRFGVVLLGPVVVFVDVVPWGPLAVFVGVVPLVLGRGLVSVASCRQR